MKKLKNLYHYLNSFFTNRVAIIINSQSKNTSRYVAVSRIKNYLNLLTSSHDIIKIMMQDKDDYTKIHDFEISLDENNQYIFT
jgi:regulatory protein YycH of two-component signal transduction system YycFG